MATVVVSIEVKASGRADARVAASEVAWALSSLGLQVTLAGGNDWPALDGNGREAAVARHERLATLVAHGHEFYVEVSR